MREARGPFQIAWYQNRWSRKIYPQNSNEPDTENWVTESKVAGYDEEASARFQYLYIRQVHSSTNPAQEALHVGSA
jgi:hypothetical protein